MFVVEMTKWLRDHPETHLDRQQTLSFLRGKRIFSDSLDCSHAIVYAVVIDQAEIFFHLINL